MQEHNFIIELEKALRSMPQEQRDDVLADYRAHIFEARERGKSDESIAAALGDPRTLARTFIADYHMAKIRQPLEGQKLGTSLYHMARAFLILISILAFNFFFMLWPILGVAMFLGLVWLVLSATIIGIFGVLVASIATMLTPTLGIGIYAKLALVFYAIAGLSGSCLACMVLFFVSRWFLVGVMKYIKINVKVLQPD